MADGGTFPHVVHRPDNRFAGGDDLLNIVQGQHALIDPMQVNDICLFENRKPGDIEPRIGNGYPKKILPAEKIICPNNETFPDKRELSLPRLTDSLPSLRKITVGMLMTPKRMASSGCSSVLTLLSLYI